MTTKPPSIMETAKTIPETLGDLRKLFTRYNIEDWEPIPGEKDRSYSVRYMQSGEWATITSYLQPTKEGNVRQCYQVIRNLFLWAERGVGGVSQGVTFIHGELATTGNGAQPTNQLAEDYATLGVDPGDSLEEIQSVWRAKVRHSHPDHAKGDEDKRIREERTVRLNTAWGRIEKHRNGENK